MKIGLIKLIDRLAGGILTASLPAAKKRPVPELRKVLVIRPGGIGDAVLLLPVLRALQEVYPGCSVDLLAERRNASVFGLIAGVRTVRCYDSLSGLADVLNEGYDIVIDTEQWYRVSAVIARLTGAALLIGFATNARGKLFSHPVAYKQERYEAYSFFDLLEPLGIEAPPTIVAPFLELPLAAKAEAETILAPLAGTPFLTLFPGASVPEKQWGIRNFLELIAELSLRGLPVVLVGGKDTRRASAELADAGWVLDVTGRTSLATTAAIIARGSALVSGDSGLLHIAVGSGTPTVSLFGPSDPVKWGPRGERDFVCSAGLSCSPCSRFGTIPHCPCGASCIAGITVQEVLKGIEKVLGHH